LFLSDGEEHQRATDFLKGIDEASLLQNWYNSHVTELGYSDHSGLRPYRMVCAVLYFEPQLSTVEEILGK